MSLQLSNSHQLAMQIFGQTMVSEAWDGIESPFSLQLSNSSRKSPLAGYVNIMLIHHTLNIAFPTLLTKPQAQPQHLDTLLSRLGSIFPFPQGFNTVHGLLITSS